MNQQPDPSQIEATIAQERAKLASTLDALQDRVSVDALAQDALGMIKANTENYTRSIDQAVRANPVALALVGVGLAWLVFGSRKPAPLSLTKKAALSTWEDDGGPALPSDQHPEHWAIETDTLRKRASDALQRIEADARDVSQSIRDFAAERAAVVADLSSGLKRSLRHGLDGLSVAAHDRIVNAREAAYAARIRVERMAKATPKDMGRMIDDHPMVTGAVVMALGAVLGAVLPRTDIEDRTFGAERNRLMDQARDMLAQERAAISRLAGKIGSDLASTARDTIDLVSDRVADTGTKLSAQIARESESV
jgi:hypothetical protein